MKRYLLILLAIISLGSCKQDLPSSNASSFDVSILDDLETKEQKSEFLQLIWDLDQGERKRLTAISIEYGADSEEYKDAINSMNASDDKNLAKIEWYLDRYDYPSKKIFSEELSMVPALVIHHSNNDNVRRRNFFKLKKAYDNGDLDPDFFALYLGRIYQMERGHYFRMPSPYLLEDQIDSLITVLDLPR